MLIENDTSQVTGVDQAHKQIPDVGASCSVL